MSDLERAMNPGGLPAPTSAPPVSPDAPYKAPRKRRKRADPVKSMKRKRRAALTQKRSGAKVVKAQIKRRGRADVTMDLAGTMELLGSMHRTDVPVFQVISEALSSRAKPSRRRLLAAIQKVFG